MIIPTKPNMKVTLLTLGLLLAAGAAVTAQVTAGPSIQVNERARLDKNCATIDIPAEAEIHTVYDPGSTKVEVGWIVGEQENHVDLPATPAQNCTSKNKALLQQVRSDYQAQVRDTCNEFQSILAGNTPVPTKDGQQGNLAAAREYVKKHCR